MNKLATLKKIASTLMGGAKAAGTGLLASQTTTILLLIALAFSGLFATTLHYRSEALVAKAKLLAFETDVNFATQQQKHSGELATTKALNTLEQNREKHLHLARQLNARLHTLGLCTTHPNHSGGVRLPESTARTHANHPATANPFLQPGSASPLSGTSPSQGEGQGQKPAAESQAPSQPPITLEMIQTDLLMCHQKLSTCSALQEWLRGVGQVAE